MERFLSITIVSTDQSLYYSIPCKSTDPFYKVENKLYQEYPQYREKDCFFLNRGQKINRNKTMDENHIKNGDLVMIFPLDE